MTTALATVHATAIIDGNVQLGENVEIGAYCCISGNITIGKNTVIKHHVSIEGNTTIGEVVGMSFVNMLQ